MRDGDLRAAAPPTSSARRSMRGNRGAVTLVGAVLGLAIVAAGLFAWLFLPLGSAVSAMITTPTDAFGVLGVVFGAVVAWRL